MRFEKGHKENTRKRIVEVASKRFRKDGIAASGLAGIMTESGLTNGAFYAHFDSKDALVSETLSHVLGEKFIQLEKENDGTLTIEKALKSYLNPSHINGREKGCPSSALLPEIARQPDRSKEAYEEGILPYIKTIATLLSEPDPSKAMSNATAIFGLMVGSLQIARAVSDRSLAEKILEDGVSAALQLAKGCGAWQSPP
jgi:AcrR family transcriptional regulator